MTAKEELHRLVEALPRSRWRPARELLERLSDGEQPIDEEPLSVAERRAILRSLEQVRRGDAIARESHRKPRTR